jgi:hypothetical protein
VEVAAWTEKEEPLAYATTARDYRCRLPRPAEPADLCIPVVYIPVVANGLPNHRSFLGHCAGRPRPPCRRRAMEAEEVGSFTNHHRFRAQHPVGGSLDSCRVTSHGQTPRGGCGRRLRPCPCAGDAAELATRFRCHLLREENCAQQSARHRRCTGHSGTAPC